MRQIVEGKLYDTDKAQVIFNGKTKYGERIEIYMTEKHAFFVLDIESQQLVLIDGGENTVKELLARKDVDKYIDLFGHPEET